MNYWEMKYPRNAEHLAEMQEMLRTQEKLDAPLPAPTPVPGPMPLAPAKKVESGKARWWYIAPDGNKIEVG